MFGDLVEDHPSHGNLRLEHLEEVPCDGFAFTILVRRKEKLVGTLELLLEFGDGRLLVGVDDIEGGETIVCVDCVLGPGLFAQGLWEF